jgi:hypothetical protein
VQWGVTMTKLEKFSDGLQRFFATPSLMKGEDPAVYAELYAYVEELVDPHDVWDQMMVSDITNHFWEQQRYRRLIATVINSRRRPALKSMLEDTIADDYFRDQNATVDCYFGDPESAANDLKSHGHEVSDIDGVAAELSMKTLIGLENLAFRHELRREAILREVERRREERSNQQQASVRVREATGNLFDPRRQVALPTFTEPSQ